MQKIYKKNVLMILIIFMISILSIVGLVYTVDPCNVYNFRNKYQVCTQRFTNAGKIRHYFYDNDYDSLSIGTSIAQNFILDDLKKYLGFKKPVGVYISGGYVKELDLTLGYALASSKIKNVLWGLDFCRYDVEGDECLFHNGNIFPSFLYNSSYLDDFEYLTSVSTVKRVISMFKKPKKEKYLPDTFNNEDADFFHENPAVSTSAFSLNRNLPQKTPVVWKEPIKNFSRANKFIVDLIKAYPKTQFYLFYPPYPYTFMTKQSYMDLRQYLLDETNSLDNVKFFDFTDKQNVLSNLAYYQDSSHYNASINVAILKQIGSGRSHLTSENIKTYQKSVEHIFNSYKPYSDYEQTIKNKPVLFQWDPGILDSHDQEFVSFNLGEKTYPHARTLVLKVQVETPEKGVLEIIGQPRNPMGKAVYIDLDKGQNTRYVVLHMIPAQQNVTLFFKAGKGRYTVNTLEMKQALSEF